MKPWYQDPEQVQKVVQFASRAFPNARLEVFVDTLRVQAYVYSRAPSAPRKTYRLSFGPDFLVLAQHHADTAPSDGFLTLDKYTTPCKGPGSIYRWVNRLRERRAPLDADHIAHEYAPWDGLLGYAPLPNLTLLAWERGWPGLGEPAPDGEIIPDGYSSCGARVGPAAAWIRFPSNWSFNRLYITLVRPGDFDQPIGLIRQNDINGQPPPDIEIAVRDIEAFAGLCLEPDLRTFPDDAPFW